MIEILTDAPEAYDGFGTETLEWLPYESWGHRQVRRVAVQDEAKEWQNGRYRSGLFLRIRPDEAEEFIKLGIMREVS